MSHWNETAAIVAALRDLAARGERAAIATVVAIEGSSYRRPGAKLLESASGLSLGSVSGGCLEADVREIARAVLVSGAPRLQTYDSRRHDDIVWGLGLGCNGRVDVFIQPAVPSGWTGLLEPLAGALAGDAPFTLATRLDDGAARLLRSGEVGGAGEFVESLVPPTHVVVCGAGDDSQPLVALAAAAGFRVTLVDHRPALLTPERFPGAFALRLARPEADDLLLPPAERSFAVVKMHSYLHDRDWAKRLLAAGLPFVGLLGPRERQARIREEIGAASDPRLVGPVGLDLGAQGAQQIAISIVAQLLAVDSGRVARPLAERTVSIHAG
jgi:xanthine/CO dehydrogenase XdhC/CoxF family maturation factor